MLKYTVALLIASTVGHAADQTASSKDTTQLTAPPQQLMNSSMPSYMLVTPVSRALDFQQAFEMLRKEKTTGKVFFKLADGSMLSNIIDMTILSNSTLILFHFSSSEGIRSQVVKVEDIQSISY